MSISLLALYIASLVAIVAAAFLRLSDWGFIVLALIFVLGQRHIRAVERKRSAASR